MSVHLIPVLQSVPDYVMGITLDDVQYGMHIYWNDRDAAWYFDVLDASNNPIALGIKVVLRFYLGRTTQAGPFATGVIMAMDTSGTDVEAGFDDFGARVQLVYIPVADLLAFQTTVAETT